ncbi:hypothetical protein [Streptomyces sp. NPDC057287]
MLGTGEIETGHDERPGSLNEGVLDGVNIARMDAAPGYAVEI